MKLQKIISITLVTLLVMSCQQEVFETFSAPEEDVFTDTDPVADLLSKTTQKDGSFDNILDQSSCYTVVLPVNIQVDGVDMTISSRDDIEALEKLYQSNPDIVIELIFPVEVEGPDYNITQVNSESELASLASGCQEGGLDDDIECIDLAYPLTLSVYNTLTQQSQVITINSDTEMYIFLEQLEDEELVAFEFPLELITSDGSLIVVNNNEELEEWIDEAIDDCDEDDDFDYDDDEDDDDNDETPDPAFIEILTTGSWNIGYFYYDETDLTNLYTGYTFTFSPDGSLIAEKDGTTFPGLWSVEQDDGSQELEIDFEDSDLLEELDEEWELKAYDQNTIRLEYDDESQLVFEKN